MPAPVGPIPHSPITPYVAVHLDAEVLPARASGRLPKRPTDCVGRFWDQGSETVLMTNPTGGNAHSEGEWVAVDAIEPFVRLVDRTVSIAQGTAG